jgi:hypothetical protein
VNLIERWGNNILAQTSQDNNTLLTAPDKTLYQSELSKISRYYGVYMWSMQGHPGLKRHHRFYIQDAIAPGVSARKFIYIPDGITINSEGKIISAADYTESTLNREWNNNYTQVSKRQRAKFHALDLMSEIDPNLKEAAGMNIDLTANRVINLVCNTERPTGVHLNELRRLVGPKVKNLRKHLQTIFNEYRWERAQRANKVIVNTNENIPC